MLLFNVELCPGNAIGVFAPHNQGRQLMQLVADIEANLRRFDKPPLGPFGSLLTLTDDRWAVAVEASIGRIFNSFILHSHRDAALFRVSQDPLSQNASLLTAL